MINDLGDAGDILKQRLVGIAADEITLLSMQGGTMQSFPDSYKRSNLTADQLIFWVGQRLQPDVPLYNVPFTFTISGEIDPEKFRKAFQTLVNSSDALRTVILEIDGLPQQRVIENFPYSVEYLDFSQFSDPDTELKAWVRKRQQLLFDFETRLFDTVLIKVSDKKFVWYLNQHHIICDTWSLSLIFQRMSELYGRALEGQLEESIKLPLFQDYINYERRHRDSVQYLEAEAYWKQKLAEDAEPISFYGQSPRKLATRMQSVSCELGFERVQKLRSIAAQEGFFSKTINVSLFNIFAALLLTYLYRVSGNRHLSLGIPFRNRHSKAFKETIGLFVETLPLRIMIEENDTFLSLIRKVTIESSEILQHRHYAIPNSLHKPVYDVLLNYQTASFKFHGASVQPERIPPGHGNESLTLQVDDFDLSGDLVLTFDLHCDVFKEEQQKRVLQHFLQLVDAFLEDNTQSVHRVNLLTEEEKQRILVEFNQTEAPFPENRTISQLFEAQVQKTPDQLAVVFEGESLTYAQLNAQANQLAHHLQTLGVGPEVLVAICAERSLEMIVGTLAILKAGGAYLPLDPAYPKKRLAFMLEDARPLALLTQQRLIERLPEHDAHLVCLDTDWEMIARRSQDNPVNGATAQDLVYVIYTSGSTGKPKGVQIQHRSLVNYTETACREFALEPSDRVLQFASISFDAAAEEIFPCLTRGATLVLRTDAMLSSVSTFLQKCRDLDLTVLDLPTAYWHHVTSGLSAEGLQLPERLRLVIIGGEKALAEQLRAWQQCVDQRVRLVNTYGPTEATVVATMCDLTELIQIGASLREVPIGQPVHNAQAYVLNPYLQPVPIGVSGELHIGGVGLARGYLNRPEVTAEKFIPHPFSDDPGARLYKTGDLVRYLPDGNIEFLGRIDEQVKIRGFRIELGEIEAVLGQHPAVREIVVIVREDIPGDNRLVAYVVSDQENTPTPGELRRFLKEKLPDYMVPSAFVILEALPLTPNGKVDRRALPKPDQTRSELDRDFIAPRSEVEAQLAQIWEELLDFRPIGVRDNFFELGGHSLLAARLAAQIESLFGTNLPLINILQGPTVEQLAGIIIQQRGLTAWPSLVEIQPRGSKPPFFCVHPLCGDVVGFAIWAHYLGPDQPFYGLRARGLDGVQEPFAQVEAMAACYVEELRTVQPEGPYYLGGYGPGSIVAFEMAQQLHAQGHEVALLVIMNQPPPNSSYYKIRWGPRFVINFLNNLPYWLNEFLRLRIAQMVFRILLQLRPARMFNRMEQKVKLPKGIIMVKERFEERGRKLIDEHNRALLDRNNVPRVHDERQARLADIHEQAILNYVPRVYPGRVTVFRTRRQPLFCSFDPDLCWGELAAGGVDVKEIAGSTPTILKDPHARVLAQQLRACLDEVQDMHGFPERPMQLLEVHRTQGRP